MSDRHISRNYSRGIDPTVGIDHGTTIKMATEKKS